MSVAIIPAAPEHVAAVLALLHRVDLPDDGVVAHFQHFLLLVHEEKIAGCVGLEIHGNVGLLRSLAIVPAQQGRGWGKILVADLLARARALGLSEIVLLTTTAADFFQRHFGFTPAPRAAFDEVLSASPEWRLPRCSTAVCLHLQL